MAGTYNYEASLSPCPRCGAKAGLQCFDDLDPRYRASKCHDERTEAARETAAAKERLILAVKTGSLPISVRCKATPRLHMIVGESGLWRELKPGHDDGQWHRARLTYDSDFREELLLCPATFEEIEAAV